MNDELLKVLFCDCKDDCKAFIGYKFYIKLRNGETLIIKCGESINLFKKIYRKNKFMKFFFGKYKYVRNNELDQFFDKDSEKMHQNKQSIECLHYALVKKFN